MWAMLLLPTLLIFLITFTIAGSPHFFSPLNITFIGLLILSFLVVLHGRSGTRATRAVAMGLTFVACFAAAFFLFGRAGNARKAVTAQRVAAQQAERAAAAAQASAPLLPTENHLVPQSVVDTARAGLERAKALYKVGETDQFSVLQAEEQLRWAEAMFAGDRLGAAVARRDGARQRLELRTKQLEAGTVAPTDLAPLEREVAEAEVRVSELQGATQAMPPVRR
jgi:hypothetical protein